MTAPAFLSEITFDGKGIRFRRQTVWLTPRQSAVFAMLLLTAQCSETEMIQSGTIAQLAAIRLTSIDMHVRKLREKLRPIGLNVFSRIGPGGGYRLIEMKQRGQA